MRIRYNVWHYSPVAQSVERLAVNQLVAGSSPARGASQKPSEAPLAAFFFLEPCGVPKLDERRVLQGYLLSWSRSCCSSSSAGVQYFFVALHAAQQGTTLPFVLRPPRDSGTIWSMVSASGAKVPWQ